MLSSVVTQSQGDSVHWPPDTDEYILHPGVPKLALNTGFTPIALPLGSVHPKSLPTCYRQVIKGEEDRMNDVTMT